MEVAGYSLRFFSLFCMIGVLTTLLLLQRGLKPQGLEITKDQLVTLFLFLFVGSLLGGRISYILLHLEEFSPTETSLMELLRTWKGGLAFSGGLLGGGFALLLYSLWVDSPFFLLVDWFAPSVLLIQAFACLGNFMNGEVYGAPTGLPWGIIFDYGPAAIAYPGFSLHPLMLYQAVAYFIAFTYLFYLQRRRFEIGFMAACLILINSSITFGSSFFRVDLLQVEGIYFSPFIALFFFAATCITIILLELYEQDYHRPFHLLKQ